MKKIALTAILCMSSLGATAQEALPPPTVAPTGDFDPTVMVGIAYNLSGPASKKNLGFTAKVVSSDEEDAWVGALGATLYPWSGQSIGVDISAGYNFSNSTVLIGYDFLKKSPQLSAGWADTKSATHCPEFYELQGGVCQFLPQPSDHRLKEDITLLTTLDSGLNIYSFRYKGSDEQHVGVIAQELLGNPQWHDAVVMQHDGFYSVDYQALGLKMVSLQTWQQDGAASIHMATDEALAMLTQ